MIYTYECEDCFKRVEKIRRMGHRHAPVTCECGGMASLAITPVAINTSGCTFESFKAQGVAGAPVITNETQRKEMMAKHDLVDANETFTPPSQTEQQQTHAKIRESISKVEKTPEMGDQFNIV